MTLLYVSCRQSVRILKNRTWKECDEKMHFASGVHMGIGMFNLVCSLDFACKHFALLVRLC